MTPEQRHILEHALGVTRKSQPYRRHFCTGPGSDNWADCRALCAGGYMVDGGDRGGVWGGDHMFYVTERGAAAVGFVYD